MPRSHTRNRRRARRALMTRILKREGVSSREELRRIQDHANFRKPRVRGF